ncbi:MAG TPA: hypothetical protein VEQ40_06805, partial [Pyrinomonadaceae bacterium]|nr:hypothetical protein [Pyrinomonadaceae bacterium]
GGDPLAAALAAGETPSPEMVAAALREGALHPWVALACLAGIFLLLATLLITSNRIGAINKIPLAKSPEILGERAEEIVKKLGYTDAPLDTDRGFSYDTTYYEYADKQGAASGAWDRVKTGQPVILYFWYRQSPRYLDKLILEESDVPAPPLNISGLTHLSLDTRGRLVEFYRVPQQLDAQSGAASEPDWNALFAAAEIDPTNFQPTESQWVPPVAYDTRKAWEGRLPDHPEIPLRIEAASFKTKPVYFQLIYPWSKPQRQEEAQYTGREWMAAITFGVVIAVVIIGALLLARRNLRLGRGDRRGAFKLAFFVFSVTVVTMFLAADHVPSPGRELWTLYVSARYALFVAVGLWLIYIALEPYVRRSAPRLLISWSRLLAGDFRDPMIGRDILVGGLLGLGHTAAIYLGVGLKGLFEKTGQPLLSIDPDTLRGFRVMLMKMLGTDLVPAIFAGLAYLFFLLLMYIIVRKPRFAGMLMWLTILTIQLLFFATSWHLAIANVIIATLLTVTVTRFGLLAAITWQFFFLLSFTWPLTLNFSQWYSSGTIFVLMVLCGLALYGFYTSLAGQQLFREGILKE